MSGDAMDAPSPAADDDPLLDESLRRGAPRADPAGRGRRRPPTPPPESSTEEGRRRRGSTSGDDDDDDDDDDDGGGPTNSNGRRHSNAPERPPSRGQRREHRHRDPPQRRPREGEEEEEDGGGSTDLDGELSGLQAAAAKTALVIRGKAARFLSDDGEEVVTTEEDDGDDGRRVGFSMKGPPPPRNDENERRADGVSEIPGEARAAATDDPANPVSERTDLLHQLNIIRRRRRRLWRDVLPALRESSDEWKFRLSSARRRRDGASSSLEEARAGRAAAEREYDAARGWHVLGDAFLVGRRGPFGTINGFRLGRSAATAAGLMRRCAGSGAVSLFSWGGSSDNGGAAAAPRDAAGATGDAARESVTAPWTEINSALGQVVLLLNTLRGAPYSGISFQKHVLRPCGTASKVGVLRRGALSSASSEGRPRNERRRITALAAYYDAGSDAGSDAGTSAPPTTKTTTTPAAPLLPGDVTWYALHHYDEAGSLLSMGYYARRNFNVALEGLLRCVAEACAAMERRDMALAAPYVMRVDGLVVGKDANGDRDDDGVSGGKDGEATVGGLPLAYDPSEGERWTTACRYLLTNLKWLVAYAAKHVDR